MNQLMQLKPAGEDESPLGPVLKRAEFREFTRVAATASMISRRS